MNKIATFSQIDFYTDWENVDAEALRAEVDTFTTEILSRAHDQLNYYYCLGVSDALLKRVLKANLDLAWETYTCGISDTCQRELLAEATLREIGHTGRFPTGLDNMLTEMKFEAELHAIILTNSEVWDI